MSAQTLSDLGRRLENVAAVGTIAEVDHAGARVRVDVAGRLTDWLRWPADVGRNYRAWRPLRPGQQVTLAAPSGDPANAAITGILHSQALPPPSDDPDVDLIEYEDGTLHQYHAADHAHLLDLRACDGSARVLTGIAETLVDHDRIELRVGAAEIVITDGEVRLKAGQTEHVWADAGVTLAAPDVDWTTGG